MPEPSRALAERERLLDLPVNRLQPNWPVSSRVLAGRSPDVVGVSEDHAKGSTPLCHVDSVPTVDVTLASPAWGVRRRELPGQRE